MNNTENKGLPPSGNYPKWIPADIAANEALASAYGKGWNHGHGIACHNVPTLGERIFSDSLGRVTVDAENVREVHESACHEAADNSRQFSPFEFTASEFNHSEDSEALWQAFERGTSDAISADLATYTDDAYGISSDESEDKE